MGLDTASRIIPENFAWRQTAKGVFRRPLGNTELGFYWDSIFNGVAFVVNHVVIETDEGVGERANVERAWLKLKKRFPLLGAYVEEIHQPDCPGEKSVEFVLDETRLSSLAPHELKLLSVDSCGGVMEIVDKLHNGTPTITNDLIAQLWFIKQSDTPRRFHFVTVMAHYITDGMANETVGREFCQELSCFQTSAAIADCPLLVDRIKSLLPLEVLHPGMQYTLPRRRWRMAIAKVIYNIRESKSTGGQTLPAKPRKTEAGLPPISHMFKIRLSALVSRQIVGSCRSQGITFGNALPVLCQVAHARVLHRRRYPANSTLPSIGEEEWDHRSVQPSHFGGPMNLRPYLDGQWLAEGGANEVCLAISFYFTHLPFLPMLPRHVPPHMSTNRSAGNRDSRDTSSRGFESTKVINETSSLEIRLHVKEQDASSFFEFLSPQRFLHRAKIVKRQNANSLKHPILHEIHLARTVDRIQKAKVMGQAWRRRLKSRSGRQECMYSAEPEDATLFSPPAYIFCNGGASFGNRDLNFPMQYPLRNSFMKEPQNGTRLTIIDNHIRLRCRPGELYLGALTSQGSMFIFCHADVRIHDKETVREWVQEVSNAAVAYLGNGALSSATATSAKL